MLRPNAYYSPRKGRKSTLISLRAREKKENLPLGKGRDEEDILYSTIGKKKLNADFST